MKPIHILVVAKSIPNLENYVALLYENFKAAIQISRSMSGLHALDTCKDLLPDLILYDYDMPDLDGLTFYSRLTQNLVLNNIYVVMIVDKNLIKDFASTEPHPFDYIFSDQVTTDSLYRAVVKVIEKKHLVDKITAQQETIDKLAISDGLTGLPNRIFFDNMLSKMLARARRYKRHISLLVIDLDHFGEINKQYGSTLAETILKEVANRFMHCVRQNDMLARLGSDEFGVILDEIQRPDDMITVAKRFLDVLEPLILVDKHNFKVNATIGLSCYPKHGNTESELLRSAQLSLFKAKEKGGNCIGKA